MSAVGQQGSYQVLTEIGRGGMARVHLAVRKEGDFRRLVAIKRVLGSRKESAAFRAMFRQEANIAGLLRHPNIVSVLDYGEDEEGAYLVMDFIRGLTLSDLINDARQHNAFLPVEVVLRVSLAIANGLHAAHNASNHHGQHLGLIHRDLSPANVMIGWDGSTAITDFGIAKIQESDVETETGVLKGKRGYMAPEQFLERETTHRSDLFSLGVVLWEMLTLRRLYASTDTRDSAWRIVNEPLPDIITWRRVTTEMEGLLFGLLAKDPGVRLESAGAAAETLERMLAERLTEGVALVSTADFLAEVSAHRRSKEELHIQKVLDTHSSTGGEAKSSKAPIVWVAALAMFGLVAVALMMWRGETPEASPAIPSPQAPLDDFVSTPVPIPIAAEEPLSNEPQVEDEPTMAPVSMRRERRHPRMTMEPSPRQQRPGVAYDEW